MPEGKIDIITLYINFQTGILCVCGWSVTVFHVLTVLAQRHGSFCESRAHVVVLVLNFRSMIVSLVNIMYCVSSVDFSV